MWPIRRQTWKTVLKLGEGGGGQDENRVLGDELELVQIFGDSAITQARQHVVPYND